MEKVYKYRRFSFITWLLIIICTSIYVIECRLSHSLEISDNVMIALGGVNSTLVNHGQCWRLFASMWLHWSPEHLISNMAFLYLAGRQIEKVFGHIRFLLIYLISGIIGDLFACFLSSSNAISAGASTALFGIMLAGATLKWTVKAKEYGSSMLTLFFSNVMLDIFMPGISLVGHLGGAVVGFILGFMLQPRNYNKWYTTLAVELICCVTVSILLFCYGVDILY